MTRTVSEEEILAIYRDTIDALYGYVSRRCGGDRDLAEDVTQEAWLRAVRNWAEKGLPDNPAAWLTTVARNLLLNQLRRKGTESLDLVSDAMLAGAQEGSPGPEANEAETLVTAAIGRLPVDQGRLIAAFHLDRRPVAEIAAELGVSERAIEGRLRRAREKLRKELDASLNGNGEIP